LSNKSKVKSLANLNSRELDFGIDLYQKGYLVFQKYLNSAGLLTINNLEQIFKNREDVIRYVKFVETNFDVEYYERFLKNKNYYNLLNLLKRDIFYVLTALRNENFSFHDFISNLPKIYLDDNPKEVKEYFIKIITKYSHDKVFTYMKYLNFKKIRYAKNIEEIENHINFIELSKMGLKGASSSKKFECRLSLQNQFELYENNNNCFRITKEPMIINSIGKETNCCFSKNGAAKSLLVPALESPLAGIIEGYLNSSRFFSFIWEMVEIDESNCEIKKCLILDNIESVKMINIDYAEKLWKELDKVIGYSKIYCGYLRNDIAFRDNITNKLTVKQSQLVNYEKNFQKYIAYDDSAKLFLLNNFESDNDLVLHQMNIGDLHRCKYIENYIYKHYSDEDFLKIDVTKTPSYILESSTNIYGYFVTRLKYYHLEENHNYNQFEDYSGKKLASHIKNNKELGLDNYHNLEKCLYLEDLFCLPYKHCKKFMGDNIIKHLENWLEENNVNKIIVNSNRFSKPLLSRINPKFEIVDQNSNDNSNIHSVYSQISFKNIPEKKFSFKSEL